MKKWKLFTTLFIAMLLFTGCGKENIQLDLQKINQELPNAISDKFYMQGVYSIIDDQEEPFFENLNDIYNLNEKFNLTEENILEYSVRMNEENYDMYFILKPIEGKEEILKKEMKAFFESLDEKVENEYKEKVSNRLIKEYQGYLIYIISNNNEEVYNAMLTSKQPIFGAMMDVESDALEATFGLNPDLVEESLARVPMMIVNSNMYLIVTPKEVKESKVNEIIDTYMKNLEEQWSTYLPAQYDLVKNRKEEKIGDYFVYIVSNDNDAVYNIIKNNKIK